MFLRLQSPVAKFDPLLLTATYDLARICHLWPSMPHTEEGRGEVYFCAILDLIPVKMSHSTPPRPLSELPGYMLSMDGR